MNSEPEIADTPATATSQVRNTLWTDRSKLGKAGVIFAGLLMVGIPLSAMSSETADDVAIKSAATDLTPDAETPVDIESELPAIEPVDAEPPTSEPTVPPVTDKQAPAAAEAPTETSEAAFQVSVSSYAKAFGLGDTDGAWATVSKRCQGFFSESEYRASVAAAGQLYKGMMATAVVVEIDGDQGRASYSTTENEIGPYDQQPWRFERGEWRWDDC